MRNPGTDYGALVLLVLLVVLFGIILFGMAELPCLVDCAPPDGV